MADLDGVWTPEDQAEMEFISSLNLQAKKAYEQGMEREAIVSGMAFMAASLAQREEPPAEDDAPDVPADTDDDAAIEEDDRRTHCPECRTEIEDVQAFVGGEVRVRPCNCAVHYTRVEGWLDVQGGDD